MGIIDAIELILRNGNYPEETKQLLLKNIFLTVKRVEIMSSNISSKGRIIIYKEFRSEIKERLGVCDTSWN